MRHFILRVSMLTALGLSVAQAEDCSHYAPGVTRNNCEANQIRERRWQETNTYKRYEEYQRSQAEGDSGQGSNNDAWMRQQSENFQRREAEIQESNRLRARRTAGMNQAVDIFRSGQEYYAAGRNEKAVSAYRSALALARENTQDPQSLATMTYGLGLALLASRQYAEAETLFRQVLAVPDRRYESENSVAVTTNLGLAMMGNKRYEAAEPLFKNLVSLTEQNVDLNAPRTGPDLDIWITALENWATALEKLDRYAEAEPLRKRLQETLFKILPLSDPRYVNASWSLHDNQEELKRRAAGQRSVDEYDAIYKMNELIYLKRYDQALLACDAAMGMAERHQSPDLLVVAQEKKAEVLIKLNRPVEAEALLTQALALTEKTPANKDRAARLRTSLSAVRAAAERDRLGMPARSGPSNPPQPGNKPGT